MESKYYIPEPREIFVGCEFEQRPYYFDEFRYGEFEPRVFELHKTSWDYTIIELNNGNVRVKYLDNQDIISEGWEFVEERKFKLKSDVLTIDLKGLISIYNISTGHYKILQANIRNKSELRMVMNLIGIK